MIPVILAGGKGERFWPLSRKQRPKQFLCLDGTGKSLLQATAERLLDLAGGWQGLWVITASHLAEGVQQQLPDLPAENLLVEVEGRDTAPAVAWATLEIAQRHGDDAVIGFFPADHWIGDQALFCQTLQAAERLATEQPAIATLGIAPNYPSTGYGYIQQGEKVGLFDNCPAFKVDRFTEKPDRSTAETFLESGQFSWNGGMFVFRAGVMLAELQRYAPHILDPLKQHGPSCYPALPKQSIDYALMEKTQLAYVVPVNFNWDDLGDWNAIERLLQDERPNVELATHVCHDTKGSICYASDQDEVLVTIGLEDVVIVRDGNVTLIANKHRTQEIKQVLKLMQADSRFEKLL
ncbi:mannose-1-phosphate guanylyltransferase [Oculatella sp. LEGE 06141]|uniref:mannose-1-phosphate guanylyltransferase n=1 Tax=Oculatella sp. LEGE 06141 TaxID=1828648 RepID=UPI0018805890|nr:mannose-1-phosphate guanylyltransferase [Oculatella sp. LEGE 06141]MBE9182367.1 mannose-1-phosphate guanylyltransferase [Oculatella sp. LEGE 06141]